MFIILYTGNALLIGVSLALAIIVGGPISGGNFNPAVTIMMASTGKLPVNKVFPYIIMQVTGDLAALSLYKMVK